MDFKGCATFASEAKICCLATNDDGQPRVRAMSVFFADETGIYLQTSREKDLYRQLKADPRVEMCFWKPTEMAVTMMRVEGRAEFVEDRKLKEKAIAERPYLRACGLTADSPEIVIFRVAKGRAWFWTMQDNFKPKQKIEFG